MVDKRTLKAMLDYFSYIVWVWQILNTKFRINSNCVSPLHIPDSVPDNSFLDNVAIQSGFVHPVSYINIYVCGQSDLFCVYDW